MKHTPGPWEVLKDSRTGLEPRIFVRTVEKKLSIAASIGPNMDGLHPENEANAKLIAAAPRLYTELVAADAIICNLCIRLNPQHYSCTSCLSREGRLAAIAKATE